MKIRHRILLTTLAAALLLAQNASAQVPNIVSYQGRVAVGTVNFQGTGQFKFALVNTVGTTTYWSNDGTSVNGGPPTAAVSLSVTKGLYSVLLGDTSPPLSMAAIPASVWANADVRLRVWFNDGVNGSQLLTPDQRLAPGGYLADGSVSSASLASGAITSAKIANGAIGSAQLAAGATAPPVSIAGTTQAAAANTSYLATSASPTTIDLTNTTANVGDTVQVTGSGAGGWAAQYYDANVWTARESNRAWVPIASSADGTKLVAGVSGGQLYTSTNSGVNWTARATSRSWQGLASSSDGTKLVAVVYGGQIFTSTDSGNIWTARDSVRNWTSVASSSNGSVLLAGLEAGSPGQLYLSTNSGATWVETSAPTRQWNCVAVSSTGGKLAAGSNAFGVYTSADGGTTWVQRSAVPGDIFSVASSADGSQLVAVVRNGRIYTSTDSGVNWTARETVRNWRSVASSADGTQLVATVQNGQIYTSSDSGVTWAARESARNWQGVASTSDGGKLVAVANGGQIYTSGGFVAVAAGGQNTEATLQYVGNGQWAPVAQTQIAAGAVTNASLASGIDASKITFGTFPALSGSNLTALNATNFAIGTLADARLSANVALLNAATQNFTGTTNSFAGNVGIGTTSPSAPLSITKAHATNDYGSHPQGIHLGGAIPSYTFGTALIIAGQNSANGAAEIAFATGQPGVWKTISYSRSSDAISIPNGNVGIGTTAPVSRLHVQDPGAQSGSIQVGGTGANGSPKFVNFGDSGLVRIGENGADDRMELGATSFFFTGGNVGIGTASPKAVLHVNGDTYAKGHIFLHAFEGDGQSGTAFIQARDDANNTSIGLTLRTYQNGSVKDMIRMTAGGQVYRFGNSSSFDVTSDRRLKTGIVPVAGALGTLGRINPVRFHYNGDFLAKHPDSVDKEHYGVIAQEYQEVFPEFVSKDEDGYLSVKADPLIFVATAAIKELSAKHDAALAAKDAEIAALKKQLADNTARDKALEARLARLEAAAPVQTLKTVARTVK